MEPGRPDILPNLRLDELLAESSGYPAGHPPMGSFLGVPVRVRDEVFGNLYLTNKRGAAEFTEDGMLTVQVTDDAVGIPDGGRRSGLRNLEGRAGKLGSELRLGPAGEGADKPGTRLDWRIPLGA